MASDTAVTLCLALVRTHWLLASLYTILVVNLPNRIMLSGFPGSCLRMKIGSIKVDEQRPRSRSRGLRVKLQGQLLSLALHCHSCQDLSQGLYVFWCLTGVLTTLVAAHWVLSVLISSILSRRKYLQTVSLGSGIQDNLVQCESGQCYLCMLSSGNDMNNAH